MKTLFPAFSLPLLLALVVCGCGPSAQQRQAQHDFRQAVAALKVCTAGSTYDEFRGKWMALEGTYTANQSLLNADAHSLQQLDQAARATDNIWNLNNQIKATLWPKGDWSDSMKTIRTMADSNQIALLDSKSNADNFADLYVKIGLTIISDQCDALLSNH